MQGKYPPQIYFRSFPSNRYHYARNLALFELPLLLPEDVPVDPGWPRRRRQQQVDGGDVRVVVHVVVLVLGVGVLPEIEYKK